MERLDSLEQLQAYPWPAFDQADWSVLPGEVAAIQARGLAAQVWMECTIWETAWYLRRMDLLMVDMAADDEKAVFLLDKITDLACFRAARYAEAGADILALGDDLGMQRSIMMSRAMYRTWLKPRLKRVIDTAKAIKPDIIIQYHSCGYATPLVSELIEAGIDVLNPVQPECMDVPRRVRRVRRPDFLQRHARHADDDAVRHARGSPGRGSPQPAAGRPARRPALLPDAHAGAGGALGERRGVCRSLPPVVPVIGTLEFRVSFATSRPCLPGEQSEPC